MTPPAPCHRLALGAAALLCTTLARGEPAQVPALAPTTQPASPSLPTTPAAPTPLVSAEAIEPGGARVALSPGTEPIVDPASTFRVVLPGRSEDARLSLIDAGDALVPATATREVGEQTVLTVSPRKPLTPASHYLLRLDGARGRDLHDAAGRAAGPVELPMVVAGSPPAPAVKKGARKRRR